jgi:hypothetical protein
MSLSHEVYVLRNLFNGEPRGRWNKPRNTGSIHTRVTYEKGAKTVTLAVIVHKDRCVVVKQHMKDLPPLREGNIIRPLVVAVDNTQQQNRDRRITAIREELKPKYGDHPKFEDIVMAQFNVNRLTAKTKAIQSDLDWGLNKLSEYESELRSLLD